MHWASHLQPTTPAFSVSQASPSWPRNKRDPKGSKGKPGTPGSVAACLFSLASVCAILWLILFLMNLHQLPVAVTDTSVVLKPTSHFSFGLNERESSQFRTLLRVQVKFKVQHTHHLRSSSCIRPCHIPRLCWVFRRRNPLSFIHSLTHSTIFTEKQLCAKHCAGC